MFLSALTNSIRPPSSRVMLRACRVLPLPLGPITTIGPAPASSSPLGSRRTTSTCRPSRWCWRAPVSCFQDVERRRAGQRAGSRRRRRVNGSLATVKSQCEGEGRWAEEPAGAASPGVTARCCRGLLAPELEGGIPEASRPHRHERRGHRVFLSCSLRSHRGCRRGAGSSVEGGRFAGFMGPQTPSTALPPGPHRKPIPTRRAEATGVRSTPDSLPHMTPRLSGQGVSEQWSLIRRVRKGRAPERREQTQTFPNRDLNPRVPQVAGRRGWRICGLTWENGRVEMGRACVHARPEAG